ncbi:DUF2637 domain-containing protein [Nocardiopsis suaedae]|uniref:DUF2637 domain-containing protein n=1 Tax=Nocardiopsis suaedae TaxID=3018444 RepID=A0ABT4TIE8_9ACTN|nr:DUF2637 domain-containing protein [Nocardiopsis suaedae]MDA2804457.1 DUF2637 domain-containing protein [Nocardiopsis suaedae]
MDLLSALAAVAARPPWWLIAAMALAAAVVGQRLLKKYLTRIADKKKPKEKPSQAAPEAGEGSGRRAGAVHAVVTVAVLAAAAVLVGFAFAMSYAALFQAATWLQATPFGDLRWMFPIGIDAVIVYFLALDLVMEWQGRRHPLARYSAYLLSVLTVLLNVGQSGQHAGWVELLGHAGPPLVIILISEGVAAWIRHVAGLVHGELPERIPPGRLIAHPVSTLKVMRLMLGWGISSYATALKLEKARQYAVSMLKQQHGRAWRSKTPAHVMWMLANGHDLARAFRLVDALTPDVPKTVDDIATATSVSPPRSQEATGEGDVSPSPPVEATPAHRTGTPQGGAGDDGDGVEALARFGIADIERFLSHGDTGGGEGVATLPPHPQEGDTGESDGRPEPADAAPTAQQPADAASGDQNGSEDGLTLLERARRALEAQPALSARELADRLGCTRGHAGKLAAAVRREGERRSPEGEGDSGDTPTG